MERITEAREVQAFECDLLWITAAPQADPANVEVKISAQMADFYGTSR